MSPGEGRVRADGASRRPRPGPGRLVTGDSVEQFVPRPASLERPNAPPTAAPPLPPPTPASRLPSASPAPATRPGAAPRRCEAGRRAMPASRAGLAAWCLACVAAGALRPAAAELVDVAGKPLSATEDGVFRMPLSSTVLKSRQPRLPALPARQPATDVLEAGGGLRAEPFAATSVSLPLNTLYNEVCECSLRAVSARLA